MSLQGGASQPEGAALGADPGFAVARHLEARTISAAQVRLYFFQVFTIFMNYNLEIFLELRLFIERNIFAILLYRFDCVSG